jgi:hypothetical protein
MGPTVKAILWRFSGRYEPALHYCREMAKNYPHLTDEYKVAEYGLMCDLQAKVNGYGG